MRIKKIAVVQFGQYSNIHNLHYKELNIDRCSLQHALVASLAHLVFLCSICWLLVTASVVSSSPILVTLMKEARSSSETSVLTRATRHNIRENTILHSHRCENLILQNIDDFNFLLQK
jgi:hypothetical protein